MKSLLLLLLAPEYLKRMPNDDNLLYEAGAYKCFVSGEKALPVKDQVRGHRQAYKTARLLALAIEWFDACCADHSRIVWYCKAIEESKVSISPCNRAS